MEEQIVTDLYGYKDKHTGKRVVSVALHNKDAVLLGMGGEYAADVAPTAAVLLGVDIPAQCEGAPAYQIFTERV